MALALTFVDARRPVQIVAVEEDLAVYSRPFRRRVMTAYLRNNEWVDLASRDGVAYVDLNAVAVGLVLGHVGTGVGPTSVDDLGVLLVEGVVNYAANGRDHLTSTFPCRYCSSKRRRSATGSPLGLFSSCHTPQAS